MPTQNIIPVTPGSGLDLDAVSLTIGLNTVYRETMVIADPTNATYLATVTSAGALNVTDSILDGCITANVLAVSLPAGQVTTLTPPTAAAIGTAVSTDLLIGTQLAAASVPVALPTATITALTPPTAAAIAAAIVANPPAVTVSGSVGVTQSTSPWVVSLASTTITGTVGVTQSTSPWVVAGGGTAGTAAAGVVTVQGIAAMTPLLVTATFAAPQHVIVDSGTLTTVSTVTAVTSITNPVAVTGTFFQATQPVSIASGQVASGAFASGSIASGAIASGAIASGAIAAGAAAAGAFADGSVSVRSNAASTFPVTAVGTLTHNNAAPTTNNVGALVGVASAGTPTYTTGDQVLLSTDLSGNLRTTGTFTGTITGAVTGTLTNNNAAPSTNNIGALTVLANAAAPTWTEGDLVTASADLAGNMRVILHAETTKVIGVVRTSDGAGNLLTSNSTTPAGHFALDSNITSILGTAPTTAGFLDIKGADGNVFVRQTTGTNLHVVTDSTSTTAVTQATASSLNATVVGTLTNNNAAPGATNVGALTAIANAANQSWTEGDQVALSVDLSGHQRVVATGAAASSSAPSGNPVYVAPATDTSGNIQPLKIDTSANGRAVYVAASNGNPAPDAQSNASMGGLGGQGGGTVYLNVAPLLFNGSTWDRARSAGIGNAVATTGIAAAAAYVQYNTTLPAPTAGQYTAAQCDTTGSTYVNIEGRKATYSAFASFTAVAGDIAVLPGSASKTIRVIRVEVSFVTSGVAAIEAVQLIKRSAADTSGTSAAMTAVPHDSNFAAASAAPLNYTVAPTPGAAVGTIRGVQFNDASSSVPGANTWIWDFGARPSSAIVLRGVAQTLCIALPTAVATQTATVSFEWTEE